MTYTYIWQAPLLQNKHSFAKIEKTGLSSKYVNTSGIYYFIVVFRYLWFFLEPLLGTKAENSSFLRKLTENIKQVKDAQDPDDDATNEVYTLMLSI